MTKSEFTHHIMPLKDKLFSFAFRYVKFSEEAADIVQDVMMKVWESKKPIKAFSSVEAWCMTMVKNASLDKLKRKGRNHYDVSSQFDLSDSNPGPVRSFEQKEMLQQVERCIEKLPKRQREMIEMRDFEGKSYNEIAEACDSDINLVKVNIHRARTTIRNTIKQINEHGLRQA